MRPSPQNADDDDDDDEFCPQESEAPSPEQAQARVGWAMAKIEHVVVNRKARKDFVAIIRRARENLLDKDAIAAGARDGKFYTNAALMVRESLRDAPEVRDALRAVWLAMCCAEASSQEPEVYEAHAPHFEGTVLTFKVYSTMIRKVFLAVKEDKCDGKINWMTVRTCAKEDWPRDLRGGCELTELAFNRCWFELADVHVDSLRSQDYATWMLHVASRCTEWRSHGQDKRLAWRKDADMLNSLAQRLAQRLAPPMQQSTLDGSLGAPNHDASPCSPKALKRLQRFNSRRAAWEVAFATDEKRIAEELIFQIAPTPSIKKSPSGDLRPPRRRAPLLTQPPAPSRPTRPRAPLYTQPAPRYRSPPRVARVHTISRPPPMLPVGWTAWQLTSFEPTGRSSPQSVRTQLACKHMQLYGGTW